VRTRVSVPVNDLVPGQHGALAPLDEPGDAELISAVRGGDVDAYGKLFERHVDAARRLARQLVSAGDVDDLVSEAFAKVLALLQRGGGPDLAFRAYLLTSVRRLHVDRLRASSRLTTTDDLAPYDPGVPFEDTAVSGFDSAAAARAFASLPERWQQVLWHTEVEGQKPAQVAPLLGMSANSVSALAYRAREGLRQAFITMHAQDAVEDACAATRANLGAYLRGGISRREAAKVDAHLQDCRECSAIYLELAEINNDLGAVLAPILLGSAGAGYLAAARLGVAGAAGVAKGGMLLFLTRGKDWVLHNPAGRVAAVAGGAVAATAVVAAVALAQGGTPAPAAAPRAPAAVRSGAASDPATTSPAAPGGPATSKAAASKHREPRKHRSSAVAVAVAAKPPVAPVTVAAKATSLGTVTQAPLAPVWAIAAGRPVTIDLTRGASDPAGHALRVASARVAKPPHGRVVIGSISARRGAGAALTPRRAGDDSTVTYTSDAGWRGTDTIDYVLTDGHGGSIAGSVKVRTPDAAPIAATDVVTVAASWQGSTPTAVDVLANDSDANHDRLRVTALTAPAHGTDALTSSGLIDYTPAPGYTGADAFGYTISDGHGRRAQGRVEISVGTLPDRAPQLAQAQLHATTAMGSPVSLDLGANASDPDGDPLTYRIASQPTHGEVTLADGNATYVPDAGFGGASDTFTYTVSDGRGASATGTATIDVTTRLTIDPALHGTDLGYIGTMVRVNGIPDGDHATVTYTVTGFTGEWHVDASGVCSSQAWNVSGTTAILTCTIDSSDDGAELGHFDPYADGMTVTATPTDFDAETVTWSYP